MRQSQCLLVLEETKERNELEFDLCIKEKTLADSSISVDIVDQIIQVSGTLTVSF